MKPIPIRVSGPAHFFDSAIALSMERYGIFVVGLALG